MTTAQEICVSYPNFVTDVTVGTHVLIDDGLIDLLVKSKDDECLLCESQNDALLGNRKKRECARVSINPPSVTERDKKNILFAIDRKVDFIAHSFVRSKQDVLDILNILKMYNSPIKVIAKIENQEG